MPRVTLSLSDMSCGADRIREVLEAMEGVESVAVHPDTQRVVVRGDADAEALKARLKSKLPKKSKLLWKSGIKVTIVSDGSSSSSSSEEEEAEEGLKTTVDECYYDGYFDMSTLSLLGGGGGAVGAHASSSSSSSRRQPAYYNNPPSYGDWYGGVDAAAPDDTQWPANYYDPPSGDWYGTMDHHLRAADDATAGAGQWNNPAAAAASGGWSYAATRIPEPWSPPPVEDPSGWFMGMGVPAARIPEPASPPPVQDPTAWFFNHQHQFSSYGGEEGASSSSQPPRGNYYS